MKNYDKQVTGAVTQIGEGVPNVQASATVTASGGLPWQFKPLQSAATSLSYDESGRMNMRINHDLLKGISPEIVAWWLSNIAGDMDVDGVILNRHLAWRSFDHIHGQFAQPDPYDRASAGARFHIVEALGRDLNFYFRCHRQGNPTGRDRRR